MYPVRPLLALSSLVLLAITWSLVRWETTTRYAHWNPFKFSAPLVSFDPRLHPEAHTFRDAKTIELDWVVRQELRSPDGVMKSVYTVNGFLPGPTIEARAGDRILLRVHNELQKETTAIHFHGIRQIGSSSMDGTPGLTQCAIRPKQSFLYNFTISSQAGTYWWHSHSSSQRADGLFGAFVIHDASYQNQTDLVPGDVGHSKEDLRVRPKRINPKRGTSLLQDKAFSERILLLNDWYHANASAMLDWYMSKKSAGWEPTPDSALINGVNAFNCSLATLDLNFKTRLRLVNTGSLANLEVSLSSHYLLVIEADGSPVVPQRLNSITLTPGQRYSVILEPYPSVKPREGESFWLRLKMDEDCFNMPSVVLELEQFFVVYYGSAPTAESSTPPNPWTIHPGLPRFDPLSLVPLHRTLLPPADRQIMIYVNTMKMDSLGGIPYGYINQTSWKPHEKKPLLLRGGSVQQVDDWGSDQLVVTTHPNAPTVIELIVNNLDDGPHPLHLHGHHFYPLHSHESTFGFGSYNYSSQPSFPAEAPVLRDTFEVPMRGHIVIRFLADAPGMWLFHCHVLVHLSTGMAMTFNVRPELVTPNEKQVARESCALIDGV